MPHKDPEIRKAYQKKAGASWYEKNREKVLARQRERWKNDSGFREMKRLQARAWEKANPDKVKARRDAKQGYFAEYRATHKRQRKSSTLRFHYGMRVEDYEALLAQQGGRCAICGSTDPGGRGGMRVDHDHATGAVRGLLCNGCNSALGHMKDQPARLRAAADYLEKHNPQSQEKAA